VRFIIKCTAGLFGGLGLGLLAAAAVVDVAYLAFLSKGTILILGCVSGGLSGFAASCGDK
jgi:hypothetical protein